ncbi:MAG: hypothetical protein NVSMB34_11930 [Variovorax sp.]
MTKANIPMPAPETSCAAAPAPAPALTPEQKASMALHPSINAAVVVDGYQGNLQGPNISLKGLVDGLSASVNRSREGELFTLESMLIGQATALETIFTSLARRAQMQESQRNLEAFLGLALKAQAQSRATISALVDLKFPRQQATFVKQANIAHGPQQVNNSVAPSGGAVSRAEETRVGQNKLLEADHGQPGQRMVTGAQAAPARGNPAVEALVKIHRAKKCRG